MNLPLRIIFVSIFLSGLSFSQIKKDTVKEKSDTAKVKTSVSAAKDKKPEKINLFYFLGCILQKIFL